MLVAVGAAVLVVGCEHPLLGRTAAPPPDEGAGDPPDLAVSVPPADMEPSGAD